MTLAGTLARGLGLGQRSAASEWMDTVALPPAVADRTLAFLEMTNRAFGGTAVILRHLERWRGGWTARRPVSILDVGTGAADIPTAVVRWAADRGVQVRITAIDMAPDIAAVARARVSGIPEISVRQATLDEIAGSNERFDYVTASLFLHHVPPTQLREALLAIDRLAVRGIVIGDLVRSVAGFIGVALLASVAGNRVVRHDGPLSVKRSFTVGELSEVVSDLGLHYLQVRREGVFRLSVAGEKTRDA